MNKLLVLYRRHIQTFLILVICTAVLATLLLQGIAINRLSNIASQISQAAKDRTNQINSIDRHLDCIVKFFAQKDRGNKAITDINACRISDAPITDSSPIPTTQSTSGSNTETNTQAQTAPDTKTEPEVQPKSITGIPALDGLLHGLGL